MDTQLFERFIPVICSLTAAELDGASTLISKMRLASDGNLEVCYAPFEYINTQARVVIVGITPGKTQMVNAIKEARRQIDDGADAEQALIAAKRTGAFSGAMRPNLVGLLDHVGLNDWLGIHTCDELFGAAAHLVQTTSALRNPVFANGENYNGAPSMTSHPLLREHLLAGFGKDAETLPNAVFVPLGDKVADALHFLADRGLLDRDRILDGLPHPSGANAERIAYFMGRKLRSSLSSKTDPDKLDEARDKVTSKIARLTEERPTFLATKALTDVDHGASETRGATSWNLALTVVDRRTQTTGKVPSGKSRERAPSAANKPDLAPILRAFEDAGCRTTKTLEKVVELHTPAGKVLYLIKTTSRPGSVQLMAHPEHHATDLAALPGIADVGEAHGFHSNMTAFPKRINNGKTPTAHGWPMRLETESAIGPFVRAFDRLSA